MCSSPAATAQGTPKQRHVLPNLHTVADERGKRREFPSRACRKEKNEEEDLGPRKHGKSETDGVSENFWVLLFLYKSDSPGGEIPLSETKEIYFKIFFKYRPV